MSMTVSMKSNGTPWVAVGRMQPPAAKIDRRCRVVIIRPCPPSKPGSGFENETIDKRIPELPRCGDSGGATADDCDLGIAARHSGSLRWLVMHTHYAVSCWRRTRTGKAAVQPETPTAGFVRREYPNETRLAKERLY
jgi:hypothetical protein